MLLTIRSTKMLDVISMFVSRYSSVVISSSMTVMAAAVATIGLEFQAA
jgi:hypothetical protein